MLRTRCTSMMTASVSGRRLMSLIDTMRWPPTTPSISSWTLVWPTIENNSHHQKYIYIYIYINEANNSSNNNDNNDELTTPFETEEKVSFSVGTLKNSSGMRVLSNVRVTGDAMGATRGGGSNNSNNNSRHFLLLLLLLLLLQRPQPIPD